MAPTRCAQSTVSLFVAIITIASSCKDDGSQSQLSARAPQAAIPDGGVLGATPDTAASPPPSASIVDAGSDAMPDAFGPAAKHVETTLYDLSFDGLSKCSLVNSAATPTSLVGAAIRVRAKTREMFVAPQDFTLEQGGVIVSARHVNPPTLARCLPLLRAMQLNVNQSAQGFVLFELPARFREGGAPVVLAYRPTRWGGARRVEFAIPPCLDVCTDTATVGKKAKSVGARSRARRNER